MQSSLLHVVIWVHVSYLSSCEKLRQYTTITNCCCRSPGRIIEAYIEPFEALSVDGYLNVYVQNTGSISASYTVSVSHCSGGVDWIPSKTITIDPLQQVNVSFTVRSYHSIGQINSCDSMFMDVYVTIDSLVKYFIRCIVQLLDQTAEVLDNLTINFRTLDTCFCYGYCGCSVSIKNHIRIYTCICVCNVHCMCVYMYLCVYVCMCVLCTSLCSVVIMSLSVPQDQHIKVPTLLSLCLSISKSLNFSF